MNIRILLVIFFVVCSCATRRSNEMVSAVRTDRSPEFTVKYLPGYNFVFVAEVKNLPLEAWNSIQSQFTRPFLELIELSGLVLVSARGGENFSVGLFCKDQTDCQRKIAGIKESGFFKISDYAKVFPVLGMQNQNTMNAGALSDTAWLNEQNKQIFVEFQASLANFENRDAFASDLESVGRQGAPFLPEPLVPQLTTYGLPFFAQTASKSVFLISKCSESKYCQNASSSLHTNSQKITGLSVVSGNDVSGVVPEGKLDTQQLAELVKGKGGLEPGNSKELISEACREPAYKTFLTSSGQSGSEAYAVNPIFSEPVKGWQRQLSEAFSPAGPGYLVIKFKELFRFDELQKMYDALGALGANHREFDSLTTASNRSSRSQANFSQNRRELYQRCGIIDLERDLKFLVTEGLKSERLSLSYTQVRRFTAADPVLFSTFHPDNDEHVTMTLALWGNGTFSHRC